LFWNSQTAVEKAHIIRAFRFELSRAQVPAVRARVVAMLANVADDLAASVAQGLGMPVPAALPKVIEKVPAPEIEASPALSLFVRPGDGSIRTRRIAILVADGVAGAELKALHDGLSEQEAIPRFVGARLGSIESAEGDSIVVDATLEAVPAVLYDALVVPDGRDAVKTLGSLGHAAEFVKEQYRHCKPILVLGAGQDLVENAGVPLTLANGDPDPGLLQFPAEDIELALEQFVAAIAKHRHFAREMDPPPV
jgi:catalase